MGTFNRQNPHIRYLIQGLFIFSILTAAVSLLHQNPSLQTSALIPALWGAGALLPGWRGAFPPPVLGLTGSLLPRGLKLYLWSSAIVFPLYAAGFYTSWRLGLSVPTYSPSFAVPLLRFIVYNVAAVAFFEELFFRGYLYDRFAGAVLSLPEGDRRAFWIPIISTAFLFGAAHVAVDLDPARLSVFFPALLFGWLRAKTGSLVAPILSHATANILMETLIRSV